jgi:hypothetical protein
LPPNQVVILVCSVLHPSEVLGLLIVHLTLILRDGFLSPYLSVLSEFTNRLTVGSRVVAELLKEGGLVRNRVFIFIYRL